MRVVLLDAEGNARGYDLLQAFRSATMSDWRALIADTGRGSAAVQRGLNTMSDIAELSEDADMSSELESILIDTLTDLVFLARRTAGERPLRWEAVSDSLPYMETLTAMGDAARRMAEAKAEANTADPTRVPTGSVRDASGERTASRTDSVTATT